MILDVSKAKCNMKNFTLHVFQNALCVSHITRKSNPDQEKTFLCWKSNSRPDSWEKHSLKSPSKRYSQKLNVPWRFSASWGSTSWIPFPHIDYLVNPIDYSIFLSTFWKASAFILLFPNTGEKQQNTGYDITAATIVTNWILIFTYTYTTCACHQIKRQINPDAERTR